MSPPPPSLDRFLRHLAAEGLPVGARELLRLEQVFRLGPERAGGDGEDRLGEADRDRASLRRILAGALVHSPAERAIFDRVYRQWTDELEAWLERGSGAERIEARDRPEKQADRGDRGGATRPAPRSGRRPSRLRIALARAAMLLLALLLALFEADSLRKVPIEPPDPEPQIELPRFTPDLPGDLELVDLGPAPTTYRDWVPTIEITAAPPAALFGQLAPLLLGLLSLGGAGTLWLWHRRRILPQVVAAEPLPGPERLPLRPLPAAGPELLSGDDARLLVWGVDRFQSEDPTPELDLERTVGRTAEEAGLPQLVYRHESELREVWLWVDWSADDEAIEAYCEELRDALEGAALPVRLGSFAGYPAELFWDEGQRFLPEEVEGRRQTAIVAICTDGERLVSHLGARSLRAAGAAIGGSAAASDRDLRARPLRQLLLALADWPRLAFVDFSRGRSGLGPALSSFDLACVLPEELAGFVGAGGGAVRRPSRPAPVQDLRTWAACLALSPRPVDRRDAYALRRELGLAVSPWAYRELTARALVARPSGGAEAARPAQVRGGGLVWQEEDRRALLNWLGDAESAVGADGRPRPGSLIDRALTFWEERLAREAAERSRRQELHPWQRTAAERHLLMEGSLLRLWREPERATLELAPLRHGPLASAVREALSRLAPADTADRERHVRLPWRLDAVRDAGGLAADEIRLLLAELGLGGLGEGKRRYPGRLVSAIGLLLGLGATLVAAALVGAGGPPARIELDDGLDPLPAGVFAYVAGAGEEDGNGLEPGESFYAGTPRQLWVGERPLAAGDSVRVRWEERELPCRVRVGDSQLWRCGLSPRRAVAREAMEWPRRSLALVAAPAGSEAGLEFAAALLDAGAIDAALVGPDAAEKAGSLIDPLDAGLGLDQLIVVADGGTPLPKLIDATGRFVVLEVGAPYTVRLVSQDGSEESFEKTFDLEADPSLEEPVGLIELTAGGRSVSLANCPSLEAEHPKTGIRFVRVCSGSFVMGSSDDDPQAFADEKPAHEVELSGFWIGKHEVTVGQYLKWGFTIDRRFSSGSPVSEALPVTSLTWEEARKYCRSLGSADEWEYDLPTEAEWEYAARGYTGRTYPWGEEPPDAMRAVSGKEAAPGEVDERPLGAGPFGTLDQAGNGLEWVVDCYADYTVRASSSRRDPVWDGGCEGPLSRYLVLRGGSFDEDTASLRSAVRLRRAPEERDERHGFRCVRRSTRSSATVSQSTREATGTEE